MSLWAYPAQAAFGRALPKSKIYEHSHANTRLKDLFVKQVEQIVWQFKLAPETINVPAAPDVQEIQIFRVQLKAHKLHTDVLRCVDAAVQFPILFELSYGRRVQGIAAYKRPSEVDRSRWVHSDYFTTGWLPENSPRATLPIALNLGSLYELMLRSLIRLQVRPQETLAELVEREARVQTKQREVEKAAARLAKERQFNRKLEINITLRQLKTELEALSQ